MRKKKYDTALAAGRAWQLLCHTFFSAKKYDVILFRQEPDALPQANPGLSFTLQSMRADADYKE